MAGIMSEEERRRILAQMLSGQLMRPPPPMQATPATPLPGVPVQTAIVAPQSEQAVAPPPQNDEFALARQMIQGRQGPTLTGNKEIDAILTANAERRQGGAQNYLDMLARADIDPVLKEILAERRAKVQKETAELEVEQKKAGWDALMRAGLAMAQSNSPYFMQALASGMEAGVKGYDEAKVRREEKRARLQTADEDARIAEVTGKQAAQARAANAFNAAMAAGLNEEQAQAAARRAAVEELTLPQQLEMARLEPEAKRADIAYTKARTVDALRPPSSGRGGDGGDGTPGPSRMTATANERLQQLEKAENEAVAEMTKARRAWIKAGRPGTGDKVTAMQDATTSMQSAMATRRGYLQRIGRPYTEQNIPAKKAYRKEFGLEGKPAARPKAAGATSSGLPDDVKKRYGL